MTYKNPYSLNDFSKDRINLRRTKLAHQIEAGLFNACVPNNMAVIAERGMGATSTIRKVLQEQTHGPSCPYHIVQCDLMRDLKSGESAFDFYKAFMLFVADQFENLPAKAIECREYVITLSGETLGVLRKDFFSFFRQIANLNEKKLLLVLYNFDQLPYRYQFDELDWTYLRLLNQDLEILFLIVSHRILAWVEKTHHVQKSNFANIIGSHYRVNLLEPALARKMISAPGTEVLGKRPWGMDLEDEILKWSGGHPFIIQTICNILFDRIWVLGEEVNIDNFKDLLAPVESALEYSLFDRLYEGLAQDGMLKTLIDMLQNKYDEIDPYLLREMEDLGYFVQSSSERKIRSYKIFSSLFEQYLQGRLRFTDHRSDNPLTPTEIAVLQLANPLRSPYLRDRDIAEEMSVEESTIKKHLQNIYDKLGERNRKDAYCLAKGNNWI